jgi:hypothetical protein
VFDKPEEEDEHAGHHHGTLTNPEATRGARYGGGFLMLRNGRAGAAVFAFGTVPHALVRS